MVQMSWTKSFSNRGNLDHTKGMLLLFFVPARLLYHMDFIKTGEYCRILDTFVPFGGHYSMHGLHAERAALGAERFSL